MCSASASAYFCWASVERLAPPGPAARGRGRSRRACSGSGRARRRRGRVVRRRVDGLHAPGGQLLQGGLAGLEVGAQVAGADHPVAGVAARWRCRRSGRVRTSWRRSRADRACPPTSAPRWARSVISASRRARSPSFASAASRTVAGSRATWSRQPHQLGAQLLDPGGRGVGAGHQREPWSGAGRPARRRAGRPRAARPPARPAGRWRRRAGPRSAWRSAAARSASTRPPSQVAKISW